MIIKDTFKKMRLQKLGLNGIFIIIFLLGYMENTFADNKDSVANLKEHFQKIKDESNDYKDFKVIKLYKLDGFWDAVQDSLLKQKSTLESFHNEIVKLSKELQEQEQELQGLEEDLHQQIHEVNYISFLGMEMTKSSFKITAIITFLVLLLVILFLWFRFTSSNRITKDANTRLNELEREFEAHRKYAREKEIDLKRELQTAINELDELR